MLKALAATLAAGTLFVATLTDCATSGRAPQLAGAGVKLEVVNAEGESSLGSGVYIGNDIIITAEHVVDGAASVTLRSDAGDVQNGEVLWSNKEYDIAAVRPYNSRRFEAARLSCRGPVVGEPITANGNPMGVEFITMHGYVSGAQRAMAPEWKSVFMTDLTTIGGMSGGPTFDANGDVIGITVGVIAMDAPYGGLGTVVPGSVVCSLLGRV
jgi:S1-C subfamily serine protease